MSDQDHTSAQPEPAPQLQHGEPARQVLSDDGEPSPRMSRRGLFGGLGALTLAGGGIGGLFMSGVFSGFSGGSSSGGAAGGGKNNDPRWEPPIDLGSWSPPPDAIKPTLALPRKNDQKAFAEMKGACRVYDDGVTTGGLDLALLLDTTGSMYDVISSAQAAARDLVDFLATTGAGARMSVIAYKDFGDSYLTRILPLTPVSDPTIVNFINDLTAYGGGGNGMEAMGEAVRASVGLGWAANPGAVIICGNEPPYPADQQSILGISTDYRQSGRIVSVVDSGGCGMREAAARGNGGYVAYGNGGFCSAIRSALCA